MQNTTGHHIVVRCDADGFEWSASFDGMPQVAFGGDTAIVAARRLLEGTEAGPDTYTVICDQDLADSGVIQQSIVWDPPELLFRCPDCEGRREYIGLSEVETCRMCCGRGVVSA